ncbi:hypothetical protein GJAV_G00035920 [Gymnothorax javanicus]|nr:hypothetical protein GJAV_G00035920 [Gymnothorax javanicus]
MSHTGEPDSEDGALSPARERLNSCDLADESCEIVASALQSSNSLLSDLDLSFNDLGDSGVKQLCDGLMSPNCKLQTLDLSSNDLGVSGVKLLCDGLMSPNCKLQTLDLSSNNLRDSGVKLLCDGLMSPNCKLQTLDLSSNNFGDSGVKLLCDGLMSPNCKLQTLDLSSNNFGDSGVKLLCDGLMSPNCKLETLDLSANNLEDSGVKLLCDGLMSPNCKLQTLGLGWCNLTESCCDVLASVLHSPHSELRDLELRDNELQDSGVTALSAGLEDPHCKLQRLGLSGCRVTHRGCDSLASALSSNPSHLRELDLRYNHPGESGVRALSAAKLDTLTLLVDHGGENRTKPGPRKYGCRLTLDPNTAHRELSLSEGNRKVTHTRGREEPYPDHPERFEYWEQIKCISSDCSYTPLTLWRTGSRPALTTLQHQSAWKRKVMIQPRRAPGPDWLKGRVLKESPAQLGGVVAQILQLFLNARFDPSTWKETSIIPVPKKPHAKARPVALPSICCQCVKRVVTGELSSRVDESGPAPVCLQDETRG